MSRPIRLALDIFRKGVETAIENTPELRRDFESTELRDEHFETIKNHKETFTKKFERFKEYFDQLINFRSDQIDDVERKEIDEAVVANADLIARSDDLISDVDNEIRRIDRQRVKESKNTDSNREKIGSVGLSPTEGSPLGSSPVVGGVNNIDDNDSSGSSPVEKDKSNAPGSSPGAAVMTDNETMVMTKNNDRGSDEVALAGGRTYAKLPKLELTKFSGEIQEWQEFWDAFHSSVHTNPKLTAIERMIYLKLQLTGDAKKAISKLPATAANYDSAIKLLQKRFGDPQAIIDSHYNLLTNLPMATNQTASLRSLFDSLEQTFFSLEALGHSSENPQFISMIKTKLPWATKVHLAEKFGEAPWTVKHFRDHFNRYIVARESAETPAAPNSKFEKTKSDHDHHSKSKFNSGKSITTTGALVSSERGTNSRRPVCAYCSEGHWSNQCSNYPTIEARKEKLKGHCYVCLQPGHRIRECRANPRPCHYCRGAKGIHHQSLCPDQFTNKRKNDFANTANNKRMKFTNRVKDERVVIDNSAGDRSTTTTTSAVENSLISMGETVYLQTATTRISSPDSRKSIKIRVLMDSGSTRSYASSDLINRLNLKSSPQDPLTVYTFASSKSTQISTSIADLKIKLIDGSDLTITANVVRTITGTIQQVPINFDRYPIVKTLILADPKIADESKIDLLIGSDYYSEIMNGEKIELSKGLYLLGSKFGWILNGRQKTELHKNLPSTTLLIANTLLSKDDDISFVTADSQLIEKFNLQKFWDLDMIGIKERTNDIGDEEALKKFNDTIRYVNNRYYVTWPWKDDEISLPSNFQLALGRLHSMLSCYKDKPEVFDAYQAVFDSQLKKGIIEKVDRNEKSNFRTHYIPHQAVITPEKSTKLRIVYDGSAKARKSDSSINECLYRGPVFLEDICGLLIRFRLNPIALICDIEKAFLQVGLQNSERDVTRFLWLRNPKLMTTKDNLEIYRFMRVPFGFITSPFLLTATVAYHLKKDNGTVAKNILRNIYVDNVVTGVRSTKEAIDFYTKAKELFNSASMNIREWASNSKELIDHMPTSDRTNSTDAKVLGLNWNTITDELSIAEIKDLPKEITKRSILQFTASFFDPLGLFSPTILLAKLLLQKLWLAKFDWDDTLPEDLKAQWRSIMTDILPLMTFKLPRFTGINSDVQLRNLHCFCDASKNAYGISIYMQTISDLSVSSELLFAKARLAPIKEITLPRLELLAVLIGSKCAEFIRHEMPFPIDQTFIWTDSQCVLHWINSNKPLSVFVRNRIMTIKKVSSINFRYVPTAENPADLSSRGASATDLISNTLWWHGPLFLKDAGQDSWPSMEFLSPINNDSPPETNLFSASALVPEGAVAKDFTNEEFLPYGINYKNYSNLNKLFRVTAYCNRFINGVKKNRTRSNLLTADELNQAKIMWIKFIQRGHFSESILAIENNRKNSLVMEFGLFIDDLRLLRCGGRLRHSTSLSADAINPILLPKKDHFTNLIIDKVHKILLHAGVSHTLARIRDEFWIPSGRSVVFKFIRGCTVCKKFDGGPFQAPPMPPLPVDRVSETTPFNSTGLDYLGPLYIKNFGKDATTSKVWICIFTCMTTRAVHLELIENLSAIDFSLFASFYFSTWCPDDDYIG